jgi:hypothetical protein
MSPQLDPFIIYTVKLAMDFKSTEVEQEEPTTPIPTRYASSSPFITEKKQQDNFTNPMFP